MTITLYEEQIKHSIRQILHRAGCDLESLTLKSYVQMDESESDEELLRRLIRTGVAKVKTILREHLNNKGETGDDKLSNGYEQYAFSLDLNGDGQSLADLLHWFVVWRALRALFPIFGLDNLTNKASAEADEAEELIAEELLALSMPVKERRTIVRHEDYTPRIELEET